MADDWRDEMIAMLKDTVRELQVKLALAEERAERDREALCNFKAEMEDHLALN